MSAEVRVGITGHQGLTPSTAIKVRSAIDELLMKYGAVVGVSSLAEGADQIFADAIVARGGQLEVVIPCADYEATFSESTDLEHFRELRALARVVTQLRFDKPSEEAFWAAGQEIVDSSDVVVAVWNGTHSGGLGGTGDAVEFAQKLDKELHIVWPEGAARA
jgi:hypothetical protein